MPRIVTGHQRSGTTLLVRLCHAYPEIRMTREFGSFSCLGQPYSRYTGRLLERWGGIALRGWPLAADENLSRLMIYRDCRDVTSTILLKAAHRWVRAIELMEKHQDRIFIMRYEDLVRETTHSLAELSRWLGVDPAGFEVDRFSDRGVGNYRTGLTEAPATSSLAGT